VADIGTKAVPLPALQPIINIIFVAVEDWKVIEIILQQWKTNKRFIPCKTKGGVKITERIGARIGARIYALFYHFAHNPFCLCWHHTAGLTAGWHFWCQGSWHLWCQALTPLVSSQLTPLVSTISWHLICTYVKISHSSFLCILKSS
jgi:hypothetical protein